MHNLLFDFNKQGITAAQGVLKKYQEEKGVHWLKTKARSIPSMRIQVVHWFLHVSLLCFTYSNLPFEGTKEVCEPFCVPSLYSHKRDTKRFADFFLVS